MRRIYSTSLIMLFVGIVTAGGGLAFESTLVFRIGAILTVLGVIGVFVYAFRPKGRDRESPIP